MPDVIARLEELKGMIRFKEPGQCRILSLGQDCPCGLCTVDAAIAEIRKGMDHMETCTDGQDGPEGG